MTLLRTRIDVEEFSREIQQASIERRKKLYNLVGTEKEAHEGKAHLIVQQAYQAAYVDVQDGLARFGSDMPLALVLSWGKHSLQRQADVLYDASTVYKCYDEVQEGIAQLRRWREVFVHSLMVAFADYE